MIPLVITPPYWVKFLSCLVSTGACWIPSMAHPSRWRTTYVTQRRCPWGPGRAGFPAPRTVSSTTGAPGAAAAWWDPNPGSECSSSAADMGESDHREAHRALSSHLFSSRKYFTPTLRESRALSSAACLSTGYCMTREAGEDVVHLQCEQETLSLVGENYLAASHSFVAKCDFEMKWG